MALCQLGPVGKAERCPDRGTRLPTWQAGKGLHEAERVAKPSADVVDKVVIGNKTTQKPAYRFRIWQKIDEASGRLFEGSIIIGPLLRRDNLHLGEA
jgi:hypothetical protein